MSEAHEIKTKLKSYHATSRREWVVLAFRKAFGHGTHIQYLDAENFSATVDSLGGTRLAILNKALEIVEHDVHLREEQDAIPDYNMMLKKIEEKNLSDSDETESSTPSEHSDDEDAELEDGIDNFDDLLDH